jgi:hypothetical protein
MIWMSKATTNYELPTIRCPLTLAGSVAARFLQWFEGRADASGKVASCGGDRVAPPVENRPWLGTPGGASTGFDGGADPRRSTAGHGAGSRSGTRTAPSFAERGVMERCEHFAKRKAS